MRPPTQQELEGLIRDHVREEIYYREALALGLDRDNAVIRRHLRQKMEFLSDDIAAQGDPSEEDLAEFLRAHPEKFASDTWFAFRHVYFSVDDRGERARADAAAALALAEAGEDVATLGDPWLYAPDNRPMAAREISRMFGSALVDTLATLPVGEWQGPISSAYGQHIIIVDQKIDSRMPDLDEVRPAVEREWRELRRQQIADEFYAALRERYDVVIEQPEWLNEDLAIDDVTLR